MGRYRNVPLGIVAKGMLMGIANIIPGVSGGTIAVVLGLYDRIICSLSSLLSFSSEKKECIRFLLPLFAGALISVFFLSSLIDHVYSEYMYQTLFFFMGLVIGSIPLVVSHHTDSRVTFSNIFWVSCGIAAITAVSLADTSSTASSGVGVIYMAAAGVFSAAAMIVPGFSGAFVLVAMGVYWELISAVERLDIIALAPVAFGGAIGIVVVTKIIEKVLKSHPAQFYSFILGLMVASVCDLYPGFPGGLVASFSSLASAAAGIAISYNLGR